MRPSQHCSSKEKSVSHCTLLLGSLPALQTGDSQTPAPPTASQCNVLLFVFFAVSSLLLKDRTHFLFYTSSISDLQDDQLGKDALERECVCLYAAIWTPGSLWLPLPL